MGGTAAMCRSIWLLERLLTRFVTATSRGLVGARYTQTCPNIFLFCAHYMRSVTDLATSPATRPVSSALLLSQLVVLVGSRNMFQIITNFVFFPH